MTLRLTAFSLAVSAALPAMFCINAEAAPSVYFRAPASGRTLSGSINQSSACEASGGNIDRVRFYLDSTALNTEQNAPFQCNLDTRKFSDGAHTLRAVAYDWYGVSRSTQISVNIRNDTAGGTPPAVSFKAPLRGATLSGALSSSACEALAGDSNGIGKVQFYMDGTALNTELSAPYNCSLDTRKFADGAHTLKAVATDKLGAASSAQIGVSIENGSSGTAPTVAFAAPAEGGALKGNVQGPPDCIVTGSNISKVMFYINGAWTNTDGNLSNGLGCWLDTTRYRDGAYTLKAVAYNAAGATAGATRPIVIRNGGAGGSPAISFKSPSAGQTIAGAMNQSSACEVIGTDLRKVVFSLDATALNTELSAPWNCNLDTTRFADGAHTLMAVATNAAGTSSSAQLALTIDNDSGDTTPPGGAIDAADILTEAQAAVPFAQQSGYNTQVINTYLAANAIPESGINGSVLPSGETLRLGKQADPRDSTRKALAFQLAPNDPTTSGSHRAEIKFPDNIQLNKVYWAAVSVYVPAWGSMSSSDSALYGFQLHAGNAGIDLSPSLAMYTRGGQTFWIDARYSEASTPSQSNSVSVRTAERPIAFGRWVDFVLKFKQNTSGNGFAQVWMDGTQIMNYQGSLGYNIGSVKPYFKFGYYNWTSFSSPRKVLLRSPVVMADPTGSKYTPEDLRAYIRSK